MALRDELDANKNGCIGIDEFTRAVERHKPKAPKGKLSAEALASAWRKVRDCWRRLQHN